MRKNLLRFGAVLAVGAFMVPSLASASSLTSAQVSAIISLLQSFGADSTTIANVQASLTGSAPSAGTGSGSSSSGGSSSTGASSCVTLRSNLSIGMTGSDIVSLQQFLGISPTVNHFGAQTQAAVKAWQSAHGIEATGTVGPKTRAAMSCPA